MDRIRSLEMLVRAAEAGGFARAATGLRVTPSAISRAIADLERHLGAPLFHRTTRSLRLTAEGEAAYRCGRDLLDRLDELDGLIQVRGGLTGVLRVGMGPGSRHILGPRLGAFLHRHPGLRIEVLVQTLPREMQAAGMDLLLSADEPPEDTDLVARRLATLRLIPCAAPGYLAERGEPGEPEDLLRHRCLVYKSPPLARPANEWRFARGGEVRSVTVPAAVLADDRAAVIALALGGAGIMRLGMFDPALIASGALVPLLPDWTCPDGPPLHALYRRAARLPARIPAFLDFVAECLAAFDPEERTFQREAARSGRGGSC